MHALLVAIALAAPVEAEPEQRSHFAVGAGIGTAYDGAGVQIQLRGEHFAVYGGIGIVGMLADLGPPHATGSTGFCAGLRWYEGAFFVSLNGSYSTFSYHYD